MKSPKSRPDPGSSPRTNRLSRFVSGLVRQFELPFLEGARALPPSSPSVAPPVSSTSLSGTPTAQAPTASSAPPRAVPGGYRLRRIQLGERTLDYAFRRGRRRSIGFTINVDGLNIAAPRWVGVGQVEDAIREREGWIFAKLAEMQRHHAAIPKVRWEDGGSLPYLGETITMRLAAATRRLATVALDRDGRTLTVSLPPDASDTQLKDRVQAWLQNEARALFRERLAIFEARLGVRHRALRLSSAKTRWGSCSADGRILLNWRLIHFPLSSIDYVVAHELAHLKEMNHGPRFWATVATVLPDYATARDHIRRHPPELLPTL